MTPLGAGLGVPSCLHPGVYTCSRAPVYAATYGGRKLKNFLFLARIRMVSEEISTEDAPIMARYGARVTALMVCSWINAR
ncbi:Kexin [Gossypium arboreum]|uniref:Kexin n=1 Tax=Gossypium arboreum TaxID=29729 RepID=A0A0B0NK04_GOSAR|nr:Kexin [Gossypium arboreum]